MFERDGAGTGDTQRHLKPSGKNKKSRRSQENDDEDDFFKSLAPSKLPKFVELLKSKTVLPGLRLLGVVTEVQASELRVSLPHGLRGRVLLENAGEGIEVRGGGNRSGKRNGGGFHLNSYFDVGQMVRCRVVGAGMEKEGKETKSSLVDVSIKLGDVHAGLRKDAICEGACLAASVKSVEDHGYVLDFGIKGATGFLTKKNVSEGRELLPGSLVDVLVTSVQTKGSEKHALVTAEGKAVRGATTRAWSGVDVNALLPGMLVNVNVRNVLSDGLLVSFLTFFTGTVDPFHLGKALGAFKAGQKLKARVLYCDAEKKRIGLSMLPHVLGWEGAVLPSKGEVFEKATVRRVDAGLGLLIELPNTAKSPESASENDSGTCYQAFAHISNVSDTKVSAEDLGKKFKPSQVVRCRVIGFREVDGLASVSLKPSVVDGSLLDISELQAGVKVSGIVDSIDSSVMTVRLSPHLKALVPAMHLSDATHKKAYKKFKVGQTVSGAVLEMQPAMRKIVMTLKKSLIDSKYPIVGSLDDVSTGMKSHGVVTGVRDDGIFVTFYNNMSGLVPESQLGLKASQSPHDAFSVGQVVKARVLGANIKTRRLRLTLLTKQQAADIAARGDRLGGLGVGELVNGVIRQVLKTAINDRMDADGDDDDDENDSEVTGYIIQLNPSNASNANINDVFGRLDVGHLADHPSACIALSETLRIGAVLEDLVVLERLEVVQQVRLTNKDSIRRHVASGDMPLRLEDIRVGSVLPGFVASVSGDAVYVRFMDHLTGRARLQQLSDTFVGDPASAFHVNMSVRACVSKIDLDNGQISVSLKESICSEASGMYVRSLFRDLEAAGRFDSDTSVDWGTAFPFGSKVDVTVHSIKEYGILCDFKKYPDVVGLISEGQCDSSQTNKLKEGSRISATVLDISRKDGIVDLSALKIAEKALKRKSKGVSQVSEGDAVEATVLQVKSEEGYAIVALPEDKNPAIGFACITDFNASYITGLGVGEKLKTRVVAMPSADTGNRLVLVPEGVKQAQSGKRNGTTKVTGTRKALPERGAQVDVKVDAVHTLYADVTVTTVVSPDGADSPDDELHHHKGKLHISQMDGDISSIAPGSVHKAHVIGLTDLKAKKAPTIHVSIRPTGETHTLEWKNIKVGQSLTGFVQEVKNENIWITYSPFVKGRSFIPDSCASLDDCRAAASTFTVGKRVRTRVLSINPDKHAMDVLIIAEDAGDAPSRSFAAGTLACGYVTAASGHGVTVKLAWDTVGRVNLTDIFSVAVKNALTPAQTLKGAFVKVSVITTKTSKTHPMISLSLRASAGAESSISADVSAKSAKSAKSAIQPLPAALIPKPNIKLSELSPGAPVSGYVKTAGKMGVFVSLGRDLEARIKLRQLQDEFVDDPLSAYPPGTFVQGRVVAIHDGKVDVSLRSRKANANVDAYTEGQIVKGTVKRIEKFGVFVAISDSALTGMAHVSELCDGFVQDIAKLFKVGQDVQARVIKVDKENGKLSLGLKPSYFELGDEGEDGEGDVVMAQSSDDDLDEALLAVGGGNGGRSDDDSPEDDSAEDDSPEDSSDSKSGSDDGSSDDLDEQLLNNRV